MSPPTDTPPRTAASGLRRLAAAVGGLGIMAAAILGVGWPAWAAGGFAFLAVGLSKFPFHRPSRWRLAQASGRWWAPPALAVMLVLTSFTVSGVFHSFGLLIRAAWSIAT